MSYSGTFQYTQPTEDYNSEDEFTEDFKLYWSTRPLDMEYR